MILRLALFFVLVICAAGRAAFADPPVSKAEIARRAKASMAFVEVKPGSGSGFCVHASGLFLTNNHVVSHFGGGRDVTLVLNAGLKTQKVIKGTVLRRDPQLDLALVKADGEGPFSALPLGPDDEPDLLADVIAFGFPFGTALPKPGSYPTISVNLGSVTALRRDKEGELHRIQLDAALNPGNSGGPVLDLAGQVIGVVVAGIPGAGINTAIPVSHVRRFCARPEILVTPPKVPKNGRNQKFEFTATTVSLIPTEEPLELELALGADLKSVRRFPMAGLDGVYRATAIPFPEQKGPLELQTTIRYEDGSVSGTVEDRVVHVGERTVKLSQVRRLRRGLKPDVVLEKNEKIDGAASDLAAVALKVGGQALHLDLASALELTVVAPDDPATTSCAINARQNGKTVGSLSFPLVIEGVGLTSIDALKNGEFVRPLRSSSPISAIHVVSTEGDFIGQGKTYTYTGPELNVQRTMRGVTITVDGWNMLFGGPGQNFLTVGEFLNAKRFPFSNESPGLEFYGNGRGANTLDGKFRVWELEVEGNKVMKFAVDFIQICDGKMPPLYGTIRINSSFY
jgi:hypothetical protein